MTTRGGVKKGGDLLLRLGCRGCEEGKGKGGMKGRGRLAPNLKKTSPMSVR